jgi:hypothetical protein
MKAMRNPLVPKAQIKIFGVDRDPAVYGLMFDCVVPDIVSTVEAHVDEFKIGAMRPVESRPHRYELVVSTCYDIDEVIAWLESLGE